MNAFQKLQYALVISAFWVLSLLPLKLLFLISEVVTFFVYHLLGYRKRVVFENLRKSFPQNTEKELQLLARKYYRHLSVMVVENIYLRFVSERNFKHRLIIENRELFDDLFAQGKNIIVMMGHFGNWEFGGGLVRFLPYEGAAVYKKLSSAVFDQIYFDIRKRLGIEPIEMKEVMRKVVGMNAGSKPYILFMVADQAPAEHENNHWIHFLNQETDVFLGSEKLAIKFDMPVVFMEIIRHKKGIYRILPQLITANPTQTKPFEITETYFKLLEESIVRSPRYWVWSHRRWKHKKPAEK